ncbi:sugar porter family MFS transporter [Mucilaginibacter sp. 10I4]|uniref:sugar porter family MFS transporter n=1 Tax=Mucilaginibacter sp. 10I4 TaxID=3048580 RepID=UPI002B2364D6|nr:sugar porter family MFS transporter [Mucilaginibacter sp. 10I4]MEB0262051.1 sugar porter family MFS transporter [Mucilaginibacter sp. 10I4]
MQTIKEEYNHSYILVISFISALGGYLFGFDFAVISGALPFLKVQFHLSALAEGFLTGSLALGCMAGSLIAGKLADNYGRRPALIVAALIFALSSVAMALSGTLNIFILFRFAAGIGVGMSSMLSPLYISEISPAAVRGRNVAINQLTVVLGILITNLVNYSLAGWGEDAWRWMFGFGVVPSLCFLLGMLFLPESPRWQVGKGRIEKALKTFKKISSEATAEQLVNEIQARERSFKVDRSSGLFSKTVRPALLIGVTLAVFQQLCGINVVFNYTSVIFSSVGASLDHQLLETVIIGVVNTLFTLIAMWQIDKLGRKPLIMYGSMALCVSYLILAILLRNNAGIVWISLFVLLPIAVYATSLAPVTWVIISEIFPNHIRGKASSFAILCLWAAYFILVFTFPILAQSLGTYGPFYLYSGICLLGFLFIKYKVKETKGQSLEELESNFSAH